MYNIHTHPGLRDEDVCNGLLPGGIIKAIRSDVGFFMLEKFPFGSDSFKRMIVMAKMCRNNDAQGMFNVLKAEYPTDKTIFVAHAVDMENMGGGNAKRPYWEQLVELNDLKNNNPGQVIPFIHIDTRRENYYELFKWAMDNDWGGVKLYPPMGKFPFDEEFDKVFDDCERLNKPVLAHCTAGNPICWKGSRRALKLLLEQCKVPVDWKKSNKDLCAYFTHPENYKWVFAKHPKLKVCLAHFGRENEWDKIILGMLEQYQGLYIDISYSLYDEKRWPNLLILLRTNPTFRTRCLFGSDWYLDLAEGQEKQFSKNLRATLGEELWEQITVINPKHYLYS